MLDLTSPDGTGSLAITSVSIERSCSTYHVEGPVEGYGFATASVKLTSYDSDETRGTVQGEARVQGNDGTLVATPVCGTFRREGTAIQIYFCDSCSNGDMNFVHWNVDLINRKADLRYWTIT